MQDVQVCSQPQQLPDLGAEFTKALKNPVLVFFVRKTSSRSQVTLVSRAIILDVAQEMI